MLYRCYRKNALFFYDIDAFVPLGNVVWILPKQDAANEQRSSIQELFVPRYQHLQFQFVSTPFFFDLL